MTPSPPPPPPPPPSPSPSPSPSSSSSLALLLAATLAALTTACGSSNGTPTDGGAGDGGQTNCGDPTLALDPTALIDDMEAVASSTPMNGGRTGSWWAGGDEPSKALGAAVVPDGDVTAEAIPGGGRCGSLHANHVTGQGFASWAVLTVSMGWGAVDGGAPGLLPYDAHIRTGVTFWARVGDTSIADVRFSVSDQYSRPEGGFCVDGSGPDTACYDNFGVPLTLKTTWQQFKIPFGGLGQQDFGLPRPALDTTAIYTVEFNFPADAIFDFWLDDIAFY